MNYPVVILAILIPIAILWYLVAKAPVVNCDDPECGGCSYDHPCK